MVKARTYSSHDKDRRAKRARSENDFNKLQDNNNEESHDDNNENEVNEDKDDDDDNDDDNDDDEEYEVERVVGHKRAGTRRTGALSYLLKWKGYDSSSNTWEKEANVHCEDLVEDYWRRYEQAGGTRSDPRGDEPNHTKRKAGMSSNGRSSRNQEVSREQVTSKRSATNKDGKIDRNESRNKEEREDKNKRDTVVESDKVGKKNVQSVDKKGQQKSDVDEIEEYEDEEGSSWTPPENWTSWGSHIDYIRTIVQTDDTQLMVYLRWKNGCETNHAIEVAHEKFPLTLIRYYENHLRFLRVIDRDPSSPLSTAAT
ncbi:hypothetical protein BGZ97_006527 [Linnemannia gamsii]|uniref:Chromo domain-containing protein n=1 Tax=Linnemannia gamsii TaxID=64522 RepID=A0A9P6UW80_9FUNG|nr:hypothetical protein BGZ97_006527 [Linnemannia gamsii]